MARFVSVAACGGCCKYASSPLEFQMVNILICFSIVVIVAAQVIPWLQCKASRLQFLLLFRFRFWVYGLRFVVYGLWFMFDGLWFKA